MIMFNFVYITFHFITYLLIMYAGNGMLVYYRIYIDDATFNNIIVLSTIQDIIQQKVVFTFNFHYNHFVAFKTSKLRGF